MSSGDILIIAGILLVILGFFIVLTGFILKVGKSAESNDVRVGGVLIIGPIPIIFGNSKATILLAVIGALLLILLLILYKRVLYYF